MIAKSFIASAIAITLAVSGVSAAGRHLSLVKSDPANSATVAQSPKAITLWFSQKANLKLTRVVLTRATRDTVKTRAPSADSTGKVVCVKLESALRPGKYQVNWRTISRDGHAVVGKFAFTVDTARKTVSRANSVSR